MKKNFLLRAVIILVAIGICLYAVIPFDKSINKGLDLTGGLHYKIEVLLDDIPVEKRVETMENALTVYRNRIDAIGVAGTTVQQSGENQIIVEIPGVDTEESIRIKEILMQTAHLEFRIVDDVPGK